MQSIQLSIPKPCHENWDKMTPSAQGRFCNSCAKQVVDFTTMSDGEVLNFFINKKNENVCGRTLPNQLNRVLEGPKPLTTNKLWYWKYAAAAGLLFFNKETNAQIINNTAPPVNINNALKGKVRGLVVIQNVQKIVSGKITDTDNNPIPFASVKIKGTKKGVSADANGMYSIKANSNKDVLQFSGAGFKILEVNLNGINTYDVLLEKSNDFLQGDVVLARSFCTKRRKNIDENRSIVAQANQIVAITTIDTIPKPTYKLMDEVIVKGEAIQKKRTQSMGAISVVSGEILSCTSSGMSIKASPTDTIKQKIQNLFSLIKVYPNPVKKGEMFTISFPTKSKYYSVQIINSAGVIVLKNKIQESFVQTDSFSKNTNQQITTSNTWSSGYYFINIINEKGNVIAKCSFLVL